MKNKGKEFNKDREFGVLLERIHTDIKVIIEDLTSVKRRVESIFEEQSRQKEEIFIIKADVNVIKTDIKEIRARLDHIEEDIKVIKSDFGKRLTALETSR